MNKNNFNELKRLWYGKLKDSGFEDIETPNGLLKDWDGIRFQKASDNSTAQQMEATREFYIRAEHFLHSFEFPDKTHRRVWELFASGYTLEEIVEALEKTKLRHLKRSQISQILLQYKQFIE